jgi:mRNA interferase MazF
MPILLNRRDIVLTQFPFTDLRGASIRPALVVSQGPIGQDVVLAAISSVIRGSNAATDCLIEPTHAEFPLTGLRVASVVRLHKLVTDELSVIRSRLGCIGPRLQLDVDKLLRGVLGL